MIPLTPALLVGAAHAFVGLREEGGDNRGQMIELMLKEVQQPPGMPWCAAFVHHVGYWSHFDELGKKSSWPLPATASCWELGEWATNHNILKLSPNYGDVFLCYSKQLGRFHHTGIVANVIDAYSMPGEDMIYMCLTIEGNTNDDGSPNGTATMCRTRYFNTHTGDRFIRWPNLDERAKAA